MSLASQDLVRFRRRRRKRWEILSDETGLSRDQLRNSGFVNPETGRVFAFLPFRKKKRKPRHSRRPGHNANYGIRPRTKIRIRKNKILSICPGIWSRRNALGQRIPVVQFTQIYESPVSKTNIQSLDIEKTRDEIHPGPPYRVGGPFTNIKSRFQDDEIRGVGCYTTRPAQRINGEYLVYNGGFCNPSFAGDPISYTTYRDVGWTPATNSLLPGFSQYGPTAYAKLKPNPEQASMGQFIAELRELPKAVTNLRDQARDFSKIWKDVGGDPSSPFMRPKNAADQFLGYEFGWRPFFSDIDNAFKIAFNFDDYIKNVTRMNNTWIRRRSDIDSGETVTQISRNFNSGIYPTGTTINDCCTLFSYAGTNCFYVSDVTQYERYRVWAEGAFKFYRPEFDDTLAEYNTSFMAAQRAATIYGARITPTLLWKITPWTWLADWFTRVGDNINNASAMLIDSVVSKYMYVMHHKFRDTVQNTILNTWDRGPVFMSWTRSVETKQRDGQLSPYGFNVPPSSLSAKQWSILGALGISKLT